MNVEELERKYNIMEKVAEYIIDIKVTDNGGDFLKHSNKLRELCNGEVELEGARRVLEDIWFKK